MGSSTSKHKKRLRKLESANKVPGLNEITYVKITDVYDGDTITMWMLLGKYPLQLKIRVKGVDCPEMRGKNRSEMEKEVANAGKEKVTNLLKDKIIPIKIEKWDKYGGRVIAEVYLDDSCTKTLSDFLLEEGLAKPYDGKSKEDWDDSDFKLYLKRKKDAE